LFAPEVTYGAPSGQWWVDLSVAIGCGTLFATVLTLVVTPCALMVRANVAAWRQRRRDRRLEAANLDEQRLAEAAE
ncbi:MAG TPA: hypothetical protein VEH84_07880, partial [Alphaproteobacteria bacterium]|nr:hypothetical protein [Alphaproteobacteria bacterium]